MKKEQSGFCLNLMALRSASGFLDICLLKRKYANSARSLAVAITIVSK